MENIKAQIPTSPLLQPRKCCLPSPRQFRGRLINVLVHTVHPRDHHHPDPDNRPNGTNVVPEDAGSAASNASYAVETGHPYHRPPTRDTMHQSGLTKVGVKSRVWSIQVLSRRICYKHIPITCGQYCHKTRMRYLLPLPLLITHGPPPIKYSGVLQ